MESDTTKISSPVVVLWTEDDDNDRMMVDLALATAERELRIVFVVDGEQAWNYLCGEGEYGDRQIHPRPDVLVTDLKMPRSNGFELIEKVRNDPGLKSLPIYVFSASDLPCDRHMAQLAGVDGYVTKPTGFGAWTATVLSIVDQAIERNRLQPRDSTLAAALQ